MYWEKSQHFFTSKCYPMVFCASYSLLEKTYSPTPDISIYHVKLKDV